MEKLLSILLLLFTKCCFATTINTETIKISSLLDNDLRQLVCYDNIITDNNVLSVNSTEFKVTAPSLKQPEGNTKSFDLENSKKYASEKFYEIRAEVVKLARESRSLSSSHLTNNVARFTAQMERELLIVSGIFMKKVTTHRSIQVKWLQ